MRRVVRVRVRARGGYVLRGMRGDVGGGVDVDVDVDVLGLGVMGVVGGAVGGSAARAKLSGAASRPMRSDNEKLSVESVARDMPSRSVEKQVSSLVSWSVAGRRCESAAAPMCGRARVKRRIRGVVVCVELC